MTYFTNSIERKPQHYYGDLIRKLFLLSAVVMLFTLPFFKDYIPVSVQVSLSLVFILGIFAGLTNPKIFWVAVLNTIIAGIGFLVFGYYAVDAYITYSVRSTYFWINQLLSIVFLVSFYFTLKTMRGFIVDARYRI